MNDHGHKNTKCTTPRDYLHAVDPKRTPETHTLSLSLSLSHTHTHSGLEGHNARPVQPLNGRVVQNWRTGRNSIYTSCVCGCMVVGVGVGVGVGGS